MIVGALLWLKLIVSAGRFAPGGAERGGRRFCFASAALGLLPAVTGGLVQNDELVLLPVAGLGVSGGIAGLLQAHSGVDAAAGLGGRVGLAVGPKRALRAADDPFAVSRGRSQTAALRVLGVVALHGRAGTLKVTVRHCWLNDGGGLCRAAAEDLIRAF